MPRRRLDFDHSWTRQGRANFNSPGTGPGKTRRLSVLVGRAPGLTGFYIQSVIMDETANQLIQPLTFRVWDPKYRSYFYTDARPEASGLVDRWTGLFDRQGMALYENDIIQAHYDWKLGWVRALIVREQTRQTYSARA